MNTPNGSTQPYVTHGIVADPAAASLPSAPQIPTSHHHHPGTHQHHDSFSVAAAAAAAAAQSFYAQGPISSHNQQQQAQPQQPLHQQHHTPLQTSSQGQQTGLHHQSPIHTTHKQQQQLHQHQMHQQHHQHISHQQQQQQQQQQQPPQQQQMQRQHDQHQQQHRHSQQQQALQHIHTQHHHQQHQHLQQQQFNLYDDRGQAPTVGSSAAPAMGALPTGTGMQQQQPQQAIRALAMNVGNTNTTGRQRRTSLCVASQSPDLMSYENSSQGPRSLSNTGTALSVFGLDVSGVAASVTGDPQVQQSFPGLQGHVSQQQQNQPRLVTSTGDPSLSFSMTQPLGVYTRPAGSNAHHLSSNNALVNIHQQRTLQPQNAHQNEEDHEESSTGQHYAHHGHGNHDPHMQQQHFPNSLQHQEHQHHHQADQGATYHQQTKNFQMGGNMPGIVPGMHKALGDSSRGRGVPSGSHFSLSHGMDPEAIQDRMGLGHGGQMMGESPGIHDVNRMAEGMVRSVATINGQVAKTIICGQCQQTFGDIGSLQRHSARAHRARGQKGPVVCEQCNAELKNEQNLKRHIAVCHTGQQEHECHLCNASFSSRGSLRIHQQQVHNIPTKTQKKTTAAVAASAGSSTGIPSLDSAVGIPLQAPVRIGKARTKLSKNSDKSWACDLCTDTFKWKGNLKRHRELKHLHLRPFVCEVCNATFGTKSNMRVHLITHGKPNMY